VVVQLCVGGYWPCVGYYRGRLLMHEQRNTVIVLSRYYISALFYSYRDPLNALLYTPHVLPRRLGTLVITVTVLNAVHHSPLLAVCAALTGAAAYLQATYVSPACAALVWWCLIPEYCVPCPATVDGRQAESGG
jgi:hypothetical protein